LDIIKGLTFFFYQRTLNTKLDNNERRENKIDPKQDIKKNKKKIYTETNLNNKNKKVIT